MKVIVYLLFAATVFALPRTKTEAGEMAEAAPSPSPTSGTDDMDGGPKHGKGGHNHKGEDEENDSHED